PDAVKLHGDVGGGLGADRFEREREREALALAVGDPGIVRVIADAVEEPDESPAGRQRLLLPARRDESGARIARVEVGRRTWVLAGDTLHEVLRREVAHGHLRRRRREHTPARRALRHRHDGVGLAPTERLAVHPRAGREECLRDGIVPNKTARNVRAARPRRVVTAYRTVRIAGNHHIGCVEKRERFAGIYKVETLSRRDLDEGPAEVALRRAVAEHDDGLARLQHGAFGENVADAVIASTLTILDPVSA